MKTDLNVPSKSNKITLNKKHFFVGILSATGSGEVSGTEPRIRIRTKMSRIHNTASVLSLFVTSPEEGKADKGEAEPDENGHKAGQGRVPVAVAARLFLGQENRSNI